ncbi:hypothetical protein VCUG_01735 [Vavraia culicis subsp. floridensis]|uniref:Diphthamide biosynthesis protein 3 n=1 Tax=Vavraia culicis (isolate floridensis) TaxID=948595 RepID=L2GSX4_VAVCU|nr:uncharacterized protein VCUG_01735 [Vavraia culicis subsp. floridensis]ELA46776.1 hypothetical protein VCUG_01735 [Vavraia culicis subsp. floridensis]
MPPFQNKVFTLEEIETYFEQAQPYYDEVDLEDFTYDEERKAYVYPCPCGDKFVITVDELMIGETKATCPSCSLVLKVSYDFDDVEEYMR